MTFESNEAVAFVATKQMIAPLPGLQNAEIVLLTGLSINTVRYHEARV